MVTVQSGSGLGAKPAHVLDQMCIGLGLISLYTTRYFHAADACRWSYCHHSSISVPENRGKTKQNSGNEFSGLRSIGAFLRCLLVSLSLHSADVAKVPGLCKLFVLLCAELHNELHLIEKKKSLLLSSAISSRGTMLRCHCSNPHRREVVTEGLFKHWNLFAESTVIKAVPPKICFGIRMRQRLTVVRLSTDRVK